MILFEFNFSPWISSNVGQSLKWRGDIKICLDQATTKWPIALRVKVIEHEKPYLLLGEV